MRITNNMMLRTTKANIYGNKENVNTLNNQMSSQKKISRPSEDPVVAIRALRLRSNLSEVNQYYEKNIPDAEAWLNVTETSLNNMKSIFEDVRTQCVYGATGTLTADDRKAILTNLKKLREQVYAEGNTDYAGRTVFTGFRTNCNLTFMDEEPNTKYQIRETFDLEDIEEEHRYYKGEAAVPTAADLKNGTAIGELERTACDRIRFAYGEMDVETVQVPTTNQAVDENGNPIVDANGDPVYETVEEKRIVGLNLSYTDGTLNADGNLVYTNLDGMATETGAAKVTTYATVEEWKNASQTGTFENAVGDNDIIVIAETGEMLLGKDVTTAIKSNHYQLAVEYQKTGFSKGELRPEYYFNCKDITDPKTENHKIYEKYDGAGNELSQDINYLIASNQTLNINTNASDVLDESAGRDIDEMINAVQYAMDAHDKVEQIKALKGLEEYASKEDQEKIQSWLDAAEKEADYADDNLKRLYNTYIGNFDGYLTNVNLAITTVGSKGDQLELTQTRVSNQQLTIEELKSSNEDRELSDIIIDYTSAYTAYQGSLQAASKINQNTLLNYI